MAGRLGAAFTVPVLLMVSSAMAVTGVSLLATGDVVQVGVGVGVLLLVAVGLVLVAGEVRLGAESARLARRLEAEGGLPYDLPGTTRPASGRLEKADADAVFEARRRDARPPRRTGAPGGGWPPPTARREIRGAAGGRCARPSRSSAPPRLDIVIERIHQRVGDFPVYVSIDIDVLDPAHAPGTGTPEAGGMSSRELLEVVRSFAALDVVGADIVEVSPAYDHAEITAVAAANLSWELLSLYAKRMTR